MEILKDLFYLLGSIIGIIAFIRTLHKRKKCCFTYRTEFGNEVKPMLFCIRDNMYNVRISRGEKVGYCFKLPENFKFSSIRRNEINIHDMDESSFYAILKQGEALLIDNEKLYTKFTLKYEDYYGHKYKQSFILRKDKLNDLNERKNGSQRYYDLSQRKKRRLWFWY